MSAISGLSDHQIAVVSFVVAAASLFAALIAVFITVYGIHRGNKNSSAATLVMLYDGFRQGWQRFLSVQDAAKQYELSELMNLAELACAIDAEGSFVGVSKELLIDYLESSLQLLLGNPDARKQIATMLDSPKTFKYIRKFVDSRPNLSKLWSSLPN